MSQKVKITYFNLRGKGQLIKYILLVGGIEFENEIIEMEDWSKYKPTTPVGQLPLVTLPCGTVLNESLAIARYFAKQAKLVGCDDMENYYIDRAVYTIYDLYVKYFEIFMEPDEEKKLIMKGDLKKTAMPVFLKALNNYLKEKEGPFFLGNKLSFADLYLLSILDNADEEDYKCYPEIIKCLQSVLESCPTLVTYRATRKPSPI